MHGLLEEGPVGVRTITFQVLAEQEGNASYLQPPGMHGSTCGSAAKGVPIPPRGRMNRIGCGLLQFLERTNRTIIMSSSRMWAFSQSDRN